MLRFLRWTPALLLIAGCGGTDDTACDDAGEDTPWLEDAVPAPGPAAEPPSAPPPSSTPPGDTIVADGGATVSLHLTLTVDGDVVQTTAGGDPFTYTQGMQQALTGLESAVVGMSLGEKKRITLSPDQGFGAYDSAAVKRVPLQTFPEQTEFVVGKRVQGEIGDKPFKATVLAVDDERVTLDMNHPLADKTLVFDVEVVSIR